MLRCQFARLLCELTSHRTKPAFTLNKLKSNGADRGVELLFQVGKVIELHKLHARHHWLKWLPIFFFVSGGNRSESASVERVFQCQKAPLGCAVFRSVG